jgi:hypothetical protein
MRMYWLSSLNGNFPLGAVNYLLKEWLYDFMVTIFACEPLRGQIYQFLFRGFNDPEVTARFIDDLSVVN